MFLLWHNHCLIHPTSYALNLDKLFWFCFILSSSTHPSRQSEVINWSSQQLVVDGGSHFRPKHNKKTSVLSNGIQVPPFYPHKLHHCSCHHLKTTITHYFLPPLDVLSIAFWPSSIIIFFVIIMVLSVFKAHRYRKSIINQIMSFMHFLGSNSFVSLYLSLISLYFYSTV